MTTFRHFWTGAELASYLGTLAPPSWAIGTTIHNTYSPVESQWRGQSSMQGIYNYYVNDKGWTSFPHLFIACHSPNPSDDGIWIMNELTKKGTHAGSCNSDRWGMEIVGDFQSRTLSSVQYSLVLDTLEALHKWRKIGAEIVGHRDCMPDRTCPGDALYSQLPALEQDLDMRLHATINYAEEWGDVAPYHPEYGIPTAWRPRYQEFGEATTGEYHVSASSVTTQLFQRGVAFYAPRTGDVVLKSFAEIGLDV